MPTLKQFHAATGIKAKRWKQAMEQVAAYKSKAEMQGEPTMEFPTEWNDRGTTRTREDYNNGGAPADAIYDWQIAQALGHRTLEKVRAYHAYTDADGNSLPGGPPYPGVAHKRDDRNLLVADEYWSYYCSQADAERIYNMIKSYEERTGG